MNGGQHIKWLIWGVDFEKLTDLRLIEQLLFNSVTAAAMRPIGPVHVYDIHKELKKQGLEPDPDEPEGVSGMVVLSTSHVAIHTWPHKKFAIMDLFSCCDFDTGKVEDQILKLLNPSDYVSRDLSFSLWLDGEDRLRTAAGAALDAIARWGGTNNPLYKNLKAALQRK